MAANPFPTFALGPLNNPVPGSTRAPKPHSTPLGQLDPTALKMRLQQLSNADPSLTDPHFTGKVPGVLGPSDYSGYLDHLTDQQDYARDEDAIAGKAGPTINTGAYDGTDGIGGGAVAAAPKAPAANPALAGLTAALGPPGKVKTSASRAVGSDATGEDPSIAGAAYSQLHTQDPDMQPENIVRRLRDLGLMGNLNSESSFQAERAQTEQSRQAGRLPYQVAQDAGDAATRLDQTQNDLQDTDAIRGAQRASFAPVAQQTAASQLSALALAHANHPGTAATQAAGRYDTDPRYKQLIDDYAKKVVAGKAAPSQAATNLGAGAGSSGQVRQDVTRAAMALDSNFDFEKADADFKRAPKAEDAARGADAMLGSPETGTGDLDQFEQDANQIPGYLRRNPLPFLNGPMQSVASWLGLPGAQQVNTARADQKLVADKLQRFAAGAGAASKTRIQQGMSVLDPATAPSSMSSQIAAMKDLITHNRNAETQGTPLGNPGGSGGGGQQIPANVAAALQTQGPGKHTLSDGSVWMKNADGSVTAVR